MRCPSQTLGADAKAGADVKALVLSGVFLLSVSLPGQSARSSYLPQKGGATFEPQADAERLASEVFHNEIEAQLHDGSVWCYREAKLQDGKNKVFGVCQSKEGEIDRLVAINGHELSSEQLQAEDQRIQNLIRNPAELKRQQRKQQEDEKETRNLMEIFAEAFRFRREGAEGRFVRLRFEPDPGFHGSGHAARVFHHLEGTLLVDSDQKRLAEIDGELMSEVKFGGGLFGHLDPGGTFRVKQQDLGSGHWGLMLLDVQMSGKALFFKTIAVRESETNTGFRQEPDDVSLQQAFESLKQDSFLAEGDRK